MPNRYIADLESNGLLNELTTIHCLGIKNINTGEAKLYVGTEVPEGAKLLMAADLVVFMNGIDFDIPALQKIYQWFHLTEAQVHDTLVMSRVMYPDMWDSDKKLTKDKGFPARLSNRHSLEAWGHRLGLHKGDYQGDPNIADEKERKRRKWESYNAAMGEYCLLDLEVTLKLYQKFLSDNYSQECLDLEHSVRWIIARQERYGFAFDTHAAVKLYSSLTAEKLKLEQELKSVFTPRYLPKPKLFTPKRDNKSQGYCEGARVRQVVLTEFSASNRNHITWWLKRMYGWEPVDFGNDGKPKMDETTLEGLKYPEVVKLQKFLTVDKRIAQIATGNEAWLKHEKGGRIYGGCNSNGAVTGRATHSKPNLSQVPKVGKPYGKECRGLFIVSAGKVLTGADLSGLELRCLAHYMARWDHGAYAKLLLEGDVHTANQKAAGLPTRDMAKTFIYGFLYGAGNAKIGSIVGKGAEHGARLKASFLSKTPALKSLVEAVQSKAKTQKYLIGLDGRKLHVRSAHSALNTLLQSAGALISKQSMVFMAQMVEAKGYTHRCQQVAWVHDENQFECDPEIAEEVGKMQVEAFRLAGEHFKFRVPISGEYKVGPSWAATH